MNENFPTDDNAKLENFPNYFYVPNYSYGGLLHKEICVDGNFCDSSSPGIIFLRNKNIIPGSIVGIINNANDFPIEKFTSVNDKIIFQNNLKFFGKINNKLGIIEWSLCFPNYGIHQIIIEYETYR